MDGFRIVSEAAGADAASPMAAATPVTLDSLGHVLLADDTVRRFSRFLRDNVKKLLAVPICLTVATRILDALARDSLAHVLCNAILSLSLVVLLLPTYAGLHAPVLRKLRRRPVFWYNVLATVTCSGLQVYHRHEYSWAWASHLVLACAAAATFCLGPLIDAIPYAVARVLCTVGTTASIATHASTIWSFQQHAKWHHEHFNVFEIVQRDKAGREYLLFSTLELQRFLAGVAVLLACQLLWRNWRAPNRAIILLKRPRLADLHQCGRKNTLAGRLFGHRAGRSFQRTFVGRIGWLVFACFAAGAAEYAASAYFEVNQDGKAETPQFVVLCRLVASLTYWLFAVLSWLSASTPILRCLAQVLSVYYHLVFILATATAMLLMKARSEHWSYTVLVVSWPAICTLLPFSGALPVQVQRVFGRILSSVIGIYWAVNYVFNKVQEVAFYERYQVPEVFVEELGLNLSLFDLLTRGMLALSLLSVHVAWTSWLHPDHAVLIQSRPLYSSIHKDTRACGPTRLPDLLTPKRSPCCVTAPTVSRIVWFLRARARQMLDPLNLFCKLH